MLTLPSFPARLVPNYLEIAVPSQPHNYRGRQPAYNERVKSLSSYTDKRSLKLIFKSHPVADVAADCYHAGGLNAVDNPLQLEQMGFKSAFKWYVQDLTSGLLSFTIASDHQLRERSKWFDNSDRWLITSFNCDTGQKLKQTIDFTITIKPVLI